MYGGRLIWALAEYDASDQMGTIKGSRKRGSRPNANEPSRCAFSRIWTCAAVSSNMLANSARGFVSKSARAIDGPVGGKIGAGDACRDWDASGVDPHPARATQKH